MGSAGVFPGYRKAKELEEEIKRLNKRLDKEVKLRKAEDRERRYQESLRLCKERRERGLKNVEWARKMDAALKRSGVTPEEFEGVLRGTHELKSRYSLFRGIVYKAVPKN